MDDELPPVRSRQFSIRGLLLLTSATALCLLPMVNWGVFGTPVSLALAGILRLFYLRKTVPAFICMGSMLLAMVIYYGGTGVRGPSPRMYSQNNCKQIGLAILAYEATHNHLPPAYTTDEFGNPLHSWRVLILPQLEERELYEAIDLTKPWHHPDNLALADKMPEIFQFHGYESTNDSTNESDVTTSYVTFVGQNTPLCRGEPHSFSDFKKPLSKTLLVVESERHRLHWMSTGDPGIESVGPSGRDSGPIVVGPHDGGSNCVFCDGRTRFLKPTPAYDMLLRWFNIRKP